MKAIEYRNGEEGERDYVVGEMGCSFVAIVQVLHFGGVDGAKACPLPEFLEQQANCDTAPCDCYCCGLASRYFVVLFTFLVTLLSQLTLLFASNFFLPIIISCAYQSFVLKNGRGTSWYLRP